MDRRFLQYYEDELRFLRDLGGEFARENSRIAGYLDLDSFPCADPYVERLLEGCAFLGARVQLKLDTEFHRFTSHLLEMVYPGYLAPTPAMAVVQFEPDLRAGTLQDGVPVPRETRLHTVVGPGQPQRCTFLTKHEVVLWPIRLVDVAYLTGSALAAAGVPPRGPWDDEGGGAEVRAALRLTLETAGELPFRQLGLDRLVVHLPGEDRIAHRIYEALLGQGLGMVVQPPGPEPAWRHLAGSGAIRRVGFSDQEALLPAPKRCFEGYRLLREYFAFPNRFMFVALDDLGPGVRRCDSNRIEVAVLLDRVDSELTHSLKRSNFALFATPAVNLFPRRAHVHLEPGRPSHRVVIDPRRDLDFEVYDVRSVKGYGADNGQAIEFQPFYSLNNPHRSELASGYYTVERRARLLTSEDGRRIAREPRSSYLGGEAFLSLVEFGERPFAGHLERLEVEALCTNRDLPLQLVFEQGANHFTHETGIPIERVCCVGDVGPPRPSIAQGAQSQIGLSAEDHRETPWRLVSHLALNYLSLTDEKSERKDGDAHRHGSNRRRSGSGTVALRELLRLYAGLGEPNLAKQVEGVRSVFAEPIVRRLEAGGPITFGRGLEIELTLAEEAFQGLSAFLLGAVLEQFYRHYVSINSFTETVVRTEERGVVKRWPARPGQRHPI